MNYKQVINEINSNEWWLEETPAVFQLFYYIMRSFVNMEKILGFPSLTKSLTIFENNVVLEITPKKEKEKIFNIVWKNTKKDRNYLEKTLKPWGLIRKKLLDMNKIIHTRISKFNNNELIKFYKDFKKEMYESVSYGVLLECLDPFTEKLPEIIQKKYKISDKEAYEAVSILSAQPLRSFLTQEKIDFLRLCLGEIPINQFHKKYFWIDSNYKDAPELTQKEIKKRVREQLKKKSKIQIKKEIEEAENYEKKLFNNKNKVAKKLKLSDEDKLMFSLVEKLGHLIDTRKESMIQHTYALYYLLAEISKRTNYLLEDILEMDDKEIIMILRNQKVNLKEIRERKKLCFVYTTPKANKIFYGIEAKKVHDAFTKKLLSNKLKGFVASSPTKTVVGEANVVINTKKDKFKEGSILITTMTRPDFMPIMRKAAAVITDEGGITSHAAIVSRELGIPCIVGAKVATRKIKSGDLVEMDLVNGIIKVLEK